MSGRSSMTSRLCRGWGNSLAATIFIGAGLVHAQDGPCNDTKQLTGVNIAGAEFNSANLPGKHFKDYIYPDASDLQHFQHVGANAIRLPFRWERLQPKLFEELDAAETARIDTVVAAAKGLGMCLILDLHNYATYRSRSVGSTEVPESALIDLWRRIAEHFPDSAHVAFGLMNEPKAMPIKAWAQLAQRVVADLRGRHTTHLILVPGGEWSGAHSWLSKRGDTSNAEAFAEFHDPDNNYAIEVHQYADHDFSGTHSDCVAPERLSGVFDQVSRWAQAHGHKLFLGEFGVPPTEPCLADLRAMLQSIKNPKLWRGWTYWAAGKWWGNYPLSIQPREGRIPPQTEVLQEFMGP